jgi:hypothetical protein
MRALRGMDTRRPAFAAIELGGELAVAEGGGGLRVVFLDVTLAGLAGSLGRRVGFTDERIELFVQRRAAIATAGSADDDGTTPDIGVAAHHDPFEGRR